MTFDEVKVSPEAASNKRHSSNPKNSFEGHGFGMILRDSINEGFNEAFIIKVHSDTYKRVFVQVLQLALFLDTQGICITLDKLKVSLEAECNKGHSSNL